MEVLCDNQTVSHDLLRRGCSTATPPGGLQRSGGVEHLERTWTGHRYKRQLRHVWIVGGNTHARHMPTKQVELFQLIFAIVTVKLW